MSGRVWPPHHERKGMGRLALSLSPGKLRFDNGVRLCYR